MGRDRSRSPKKSKKEKKRSRSRERKRKHRSSSTSSASSFDARSSSKKNFEKKLEDERAEKKRLRKLEKERLKETETPEEKRQRRLAKKLQKDEKRAREGDATLPPEVYYTNLNNPFNDMNLTQPFVWGKKTEKEGKTTLSKDALEEMARERVRRNFAEREQLKRTRDARLAAREDEEVMKRDEDRRANPSYRQHEEQFHLKQVRLRSKIRIEQGRAKPIDLLATYAAYGDEKSEADAKVDDEFELESPLNYLKGLSVEDFEDLIEDIKVYRAVDGNKHAEFWLDIRTVVGDELKKLRERGSRESIHGSVQSDVSKIFKGKGITQLEELDQQMQKKLRNASKGTDLTYWETLHEHLKVHMAITRLKNGYQKKMQHKLAQIRAEQEREMKAHDEEHGIQAPVEPKIEPQVEPEPQVVKQETKSVDAEELDDAGTSGIIFGRKVNVDDLEVEGLEEEEKEAKWRQLNDDQLRVATLEIYNRGSYSPKYGVEGDTMPGIEILNEEEDKMKLMEIRRRKKHMDRDAAAAREAEMMAIAQKGMGGDEAQFSVEEPLEVQSYLWSDKYRPRKPRYYNRVHTGFDWNKYNQTHYDMDNPPPKIVQGYRFNIFYPDLLDPSVTPTFTVTECDDPDFAIIRFKAGPPYEDIAFKIVNREWEINYKNGYKCQFQNGIFQLWFYFKRYRYRR